MRANCLVCNAIPWLLSMFFTLGISFDMSGLSGLPKVLLEWMLFAGGMQRWWLLALSFWWQVSFNVVSLSFPPCLLFSLPFLPLFGSLLFPLLLSFFLFLCLFLVLAFRSFPSPLSFLPFFCFSFFWFDFNLVAFLASNWKIFARGHHGDYGKITLPYSTSFGEWTTIFGWISSVDTSYGIRDTCTSTSAISKQLFMETSPYLSSLWWFFRDNQVCLNRLWTYHNLMLLLYRHGNPRGLLWQHLDL